MLGEQVDWQVGDYLLARIAHLLAGANWQRGGGKGPKPKPIETPDKQPAKRKSQRERGQDQARRLANLGLLPGHKRQPEPLTPDQQRLAEALRWHQQQKQQQEPAGEE